MDPYESTQIHHWYFLDSCTTHGSIDICPNLFPPENKSCIYVCLQFIHFNWLSVPLSKLYSDIWEKKPIFLWQAIYLLAASTLGVEPSRYCLISSWIQTILCDDRINEVIHPGRISCIFYCWLWLFIVNFSWPNTTYLFKILFPFFWTNGCGITMYLLVCTF